MARDAAAAPHHARARPRAARRGDRRAWSAVLEVERPGETAPEELVGLEVVASDAWPTRTLIEGLVEQVERRFAELSEQIVDPAVICDRSRYAEVGREYRRLEQAARLAAEWRRTRDDAAGAQELLAEGGDEAELREMLDAARARQEELEEELRLAMVERDPNDDKDVIVEIQGGRRRGGGRPLGRRPLPHAHALRGAPRLQGRAARRGRRQVHLRDQGRRRVLRLQVRGRDAPRPARAGHGVPGSHAHLDGHRGGAAGGRGRRRPRRPQRPAGRRLPLVRPRRPVGQHDRLGRADHAQALRRRGRRCRTRRASSRTARRRCACCAPACTSGRWPSSRRSSPPTAARRWARATARRRSGPTTTASAG